MSVASTIEVSSPLARAKERPARSRIIAVRARISSAVARRMERTRGCADIDLTETWDARQRFRQSWERRCGKGLATEVARSAAHLGAVAVNVGRGPGLGQAIGLQIDGGAVGATHGTAQEVGDGAGKEQIIGGSGEIVGEQG